MKKGLPKRELFNKCVGNDLILMDDLINVEDPYININITADNLLHFSKKRFIGVENRKGVSERYNKFKFRFPKSIKTIKRYRGCYDYDFYTEVVITEVFGRLVITYFQENILIEVKDNNVNKLKLCKLLKGTIIGDNKFINVIR